MKNLGNTQHIAKRLNVDRTQFFAELSRQIQKLKEEHPENSVEMKRALKALQIKHHLFLIACRVANEGDGKIMSRDSLFKTAERILGKYGYTSATQRAEDRRTKTEERFCNAAKQSWHKLLKKTGVLPVEHRGRANSSTERPATGLTRRLHKLEENALSAEEGAALLRDYTRLRVSQLLEVLDGAQRANPKYWPAEVLTLLPALRAFLRAGVGKQ